MSQVKKAKLLLKAGYPLADLDFDNAASPLSKLKVESRRGVIFQYTPTINVNGAANYSQIATPHSNYPANIFEMSIPAQFNIAWQFTAQTQEEADYLLGFMQFCRVVTKAHFGTSDPKAGTPPPVLEFSAYGDFQFEGVPCVVRSFTYDMNSEVDMVETSFNTNVPSFLQGFLDVTVQVTPDRARNEFNVRDLANGKLMRRGFI